jgi:hypothetical protein
MISDPAPDPLHDLFWKSKENPSPAMAVEWRRRLESKVETIIKVRALLPGEARKEAYRGLVVDYSNETFPRSCDPNLCAHCHRREAPPEFLIPLGVGPHAWVHRSCADPWRESRREAAIAALAAMQIVAP